MSYGYASHRSWKMGSWNFWKLPLSVEYCCVFCNLMMANTSNFSHIQFLMILYAAKVQSLFDNIGSLFFFYISSDTLCSALMDFPDELNFPLGSPLKTFCLPTLNFIFRMVLQHVNRNIQIFDMTCFLEILRV